MGTAELLVLIVLVLLQLVAAWNSWVAMRRALEGIKVVQETHRIVNSRLDEWKNEQAEILKRLVGEAFIQGEISGRAEPRPKING